MSSRHQPILSVALALLFASIASPSPAARPAPTSASLADPCLDPCALYSVDLHRKLYRLDPDAGTSTFIGFVIDLLYDIAITTDGQLVGIAGASQLYRISACDAACTLIGTATFGNGLTGDPLSDDLYIQGPPLSRIDMPSLAVTPIGGAAGSDPPFWCGSSSGDLSISPIDRLACVSLGCPECLGGDRLVTVHPATGEAVFEVGCFVDAVTMTNIWSVFGLAHDCAARLWAGPASGSTIYLVDRWSGLCTPVPIAGGYDGTYGFATLPTLEGANSPPSCAPGADAPSCGTTTLHANATDPDGDPLTFAWSSADCPDAIFSPGPDVADPEASVEPPCRTCTFDVVVTDDDDASCSGAVTVAFADIQAPSVSATTVIGCLWPPNHSFVDIGLEVAATDDCAATITLGVTSVTSDEATGRELGAGGGMHCPDAIVDGLRVLLRAERSGLSDGRVYLIGVTATDPCGNSTTSWAEVRVPHDESPKTPGQSGGNDPAGPCPAIDSGTPHDATRCD